MECITRKIHKFIFYSVGIEGMKRDCGGASGVILFKKYNSICMLYNYILFFFFHIDFRRFSTG